MDVLISYMYLGVTLDRQRRIGVGLCGGSVLEIAGGDPPDPFAALPAPTIPDAGDVFVEVLRR